MKFKPKVAIGTGGYVAGPVIWASSVMGSKVILIEPNSYPGITTRLLEKYADEVHISFEYTKKYLRRQDILKLTGNPVRSSLKIYDKKNALKKFDLSESKKTLLIIGGSLGANPINKAIEKNLNDLLKNQIQLIWQVGKNYFADYSKYQTSECKVFAFIENMDEAFSACDLVVARAGASTISEIALLGLPAVLIPSPNVAENHQYHNAKALADGHAVILIEDKNVEKELFDTVTKTLSDEGLLNELKINIKKFAKPEASYQIAKSAISYIDYN
jgi:UDP-N-acetylglucosamine--N-acetylmuramyl-(pentapeptide) pyrophosphoryl-undecaprenol N-acetylglucosamine transferase